MHFHYEDYGGPSESLIINVHECEGGTILGIYAPGGLPLCLISRIKNDYAAWEISFSEAAYRIEKEHVMRWVRECEQFTTYGYSIVTHEHPPL
jgi:hypothetical protein